MFDQRRVVRPLLVGLVDIADDRRDRRRGCFQGVDAGRLETGLVVIDPSYEPVQCPRDRHAAVYVGHVRTAMQRMARTIKLVGNLVRWLMTLAGLEVVDDDLDVSSRFLREYIEQHRIHFQCGLLFRHGMFRLFDCEYRRAGIALGKRVCARDQQADVLFRFRPDLELLDQVRNGCRCLEDEINHRRRAHQRPVDQFVQKVLHGPAVFADPFRTHHAAAALQRMERPPHGNQRFHVVGRVAPGGKFALDRGDFLLGFLDEEFEQFGIQVLRVGGDNGQRHDFGCL